jgi:hypothetical protein
VRRPRPSPKQTQFGRELKRLTEQAIEESLAEIEIALRAKYGERP